MASLNLNPDSYTHSELKKLLSLADNYTHQDIIKYKQRLLHQLNRNNENRKHAKDVSAFLDVISERLTSKISTPVESANVTPAIININNEKTNYDKPNAITQHDSNFLITSENTMSGLSAKPQDGRLASVATPAGYMNPINVRTIEQSLNIDSRFRKNYYSTQSTNFSITLPEPQKNVVKMSVDSVEFPLSYYAVSAHNKNNTFVIITSSSPEENCKNVSGAAYLVTLPDGNYEPSWMNENMANPLEDAMNNALAAATPGTVAENGKFVATSAAPANNSFTYTIDRKSGKSVFSGANFVIRFNVDLHGNLSMEENIQMRLGWLLGFRAAQYKSSTAEATIVSEGICYPSGPTYGFLSINDYQNNTAPVFLQAFAQSTLDNNIMLKINLGAEMGGNTVYKAADSSTLASSGAVHREYFGPVNIQKLEIALYDEYGRIIDLNNMDMSLTLRFEKLYD